MRIKPFARTGHYTIFDNAVLDHLLPLVSSAAWKVLAIIIRATAGWQQEMAGLSLNDFSRLGGEGLRRPDTVVRAIAQLEELGVIEIIKTNKAAGPYCYKLNPNFELEVEPNNPENGVPIIPPSVLLKTPENGVPSIIVKKEDNKQRDRAAAPPRDKKEVPEPVERWRAINNKYPPKHLWPVIVEALGPEPRYDVLARVCLLWDGFGFNAANINGKLEWYRQAMRSPNPANWNPPNGRKVGIAAEVVYEDGPDFVNQGRLMDVLN